jgi:hypothetical protein
MVKIRADEMVDFIEPILRADVADAQNQVLGKQNYLRLLNAVIKIETTAVSEEEDDYEQVAASISETEA